MSVAARLTFLAYGIGSAWEAFPNGLLGGLTSAIAFFSMSAIIWGPLYTWMVIVMLFWGRGKNADEVRKAYLLLPLLLACSMGIPALFFYRDGSVLLLSWGFLHLAHLDSMAPVLLKDYSFEQALGVSVGWAIMAAVCIVVGYMFVGVILLIEQVLKRRNLFKAEEDAVR